MSDKTKVIKIFSRATPSIMDVWNGQKTNLKKMFPDLTNADLRYSEGKKNEMFEKLRIKLGKSAEDWKKIMDEI